MSRIGEREPRDVTAELDRRRKKALVLSNGLVSPEYGMIFLSGRRPLDLHETVVAVPLAYMVQVVGVLLTNQVGPLLAQMPVRALSDSPAQPGSGHGKS